MALGVMKVIGIDFVVVLIFYPFYDVFVSSWVYKMFRALIGCLVIITTFPDCKTLKIPCIFQRFYTKSYIMYPKHILGIFQIVEYKILILYSFPEIHQKILIIQELPETRRF